MYRISPPTASDQGWKSVSHPRSPFPFPFVQVAQFVIIPQPRFEPFQGEKGHGQGSGARGSGWGNGLGTKRTRDRIVIGPTPERSPLDIGLFIIGLMEMEHGPASRASNHSISNPQQQNIQQANAH